MLLPEHEVFHKMGAKDAGLTEKTVVHVVRTTNQTGEQFHAEIPIYPDDSREVIKNRVNFFLSIIQDRMEDENKAVQARDQETRRIHAISEAMKRNNQSFANQSKALQKKLAKKQIKQAEFDSELGKIKANLITANQELEAAIGNPGHAKAIMEAAQKDVELREGIDTPEE